MSEIVLRLPNAYVEVDRDEMEYVDGGGWTFQKVGQFTISGDVFQTISEMSAASAAVYIGSLVTGIGAAMALAAATVLVGKAITGYSWGSITVVYGWSVWSGGLISLPVKVPDAHVV